MPMKSIFSTCNVNGLNASEIDFAFLITTITTCYWHLSLATLTICSTLILFSFILLFLLRIQHYLSILNNGFFPSLYYHEQPFIIYYLSGTRWPFMWEAHYLSLPIVVVIWLGQGVEVVEAGYIFCLSSSMRIYDF